MKVIIAGSRGITSRPVVGDAIKDALVDWGRDAREPLREISEVVSGGATGVDFCGEVFAEMLGIPVKRFRPDWDKRGRAAGMLRNAEMAAYADALIAVWDGKSKGTANMILEAHKRGLKVFVKVI